MFFSSPEGELIRFDVVNYRGYNISGILQIQTNVQRRNAKGKS